MRDAEADQHVLEHPVAGEVAHARGHLVPEVGLLGARAASSRTAIVAITARGDEERRGVEQGDRPAAEPGEEQGADQGAEQAERLLGGLQRGVGVDQQLLGHQLLEQAVERGRQDDERDAVEHGDRPDDPDLARPADQHAGGAPSRPRRRGPRPGAACAGRGRSRCPAAERSSAGITMKKNVRPAWALEPVSVFTQIDRTSSITESPNIDAVRPAYRRVKPGWRKACLMMRQPLPGRVRRRVRRSPRRRAGAAAPPTRRTRRAGSPAGAGRGR